MAKLFLFNKPYQVLSQFTDNSDRTTLRSFIAEKHVYPAGRLDYDSEGLLLLTDDGRLQHQISHPKHKLAKTYWVQVEGKVTNSAVKQLQTGINLNDGFTRPAQVKQIEPPVLWQRDPPIRKRSHIPTEWLAITISEGRNRQVRRMTAAVNLPTLRLIRVAIGKWQLGKLLPGEHQQLTLHLPLAQQQKTRIKNKYKKQ